MIARLKWTATLGFVLSVLAVGVPYFLTPYGKANLPEILYRPSLFVMGAMAAVTVGCGATKFLKGVLIFGAVVPTVIMLRVLWDVIGDPTSHNLWPFEVAIGLWYSAPYAFVGALLGGIFFKLLGREEAPTSR